MGNLLACSSTCSNNYEVEPIKYDIKIDVIDEDMVIDMLPLPTVNKLGSKRSTPSSSSGSDKLHESYKQESPISKLMSAKCASCAQNQMKFNIDGKRICRRRYSIESLPNIPQTNNVDQSKIKLKIKLKILINDKIVNENYRHRNIDIYKIMMRRNKASINNY
jgi:hypothetical protein